MLSITVPLHLVVNSKDLYTSLFTKRNSDGKSVRAYVNCILFEFELRQIARIIWIPKNLNLGDHGTKSDSLLALPLQLKMADGRLAHDFDVSESCNADCLLG